LKKKNKYDIECLERDLLSNPDFAYYLTSRWVEDRLDNDLSITDCEPTTEELFGFLNIFPIKEKPVEVKPEPKEVEPEEEPGIIAQIEAMTPEDIDKLIEDI